MTAITADISSNFRNHNFRLFLRESWLRFGKFGLLGVLLSGTGREVLRICHSLSAAGSTDSGTTFETSVALAPGGFQPGLTTASGLPIRLAFSDVSK